jgi:hypothetical protein
VLRSKRRRKRHKNRLKPPQAMVLQARSKVLSRQKFFATPHAQRVNAAVDFLRLGYWLVTVHHGKRDLGMHLENTPAQRFVLP